jgi:hypothetical protein
MADDAVPRIAYADLDDAPLVRALAAVRDDRDDADAARRLAAALFTAELAPGEQIADLVLSSEGPFARIARQGIGLEDRRLRVASAELDALGELAHIDLLPLLVRHELADVLPANGGPPPEHPPAYAELRAAMLEDPRWGALAMRIAVLHRDQGTGALVSHRVLRLAPSGLAGVERPDPIRLADLRGGEQQQTPLREDLDRFTSGEGANDALLYGPPGTGKSATVRALAAEFAGRGLRLVQVERAELERLGNAFALLAGDGPWTLVYLDDLAFDDGGRTDRVLRAALEGGVVARPRNVLVWVTSNRLRLTRETHAERADDIEGRLAVGEKMALATRFGRRVAFRTPSQETFLAICRRLVEERFGTLPPDVDEQAIRFAAAGHGLTQRTARQFAESYRPV